MTIGNRRDYCVTRGYNSRGALSSHKESLASDTSLSGFAVGATARAASASGRREVRESARHLPVEVCSPHTKEIMLRSRLLHRSKHATA
jgi:hypothetical protein